jgi:hypothetical protein
MYIFPVIFSHFDPDPQPQPCKIVLDTERIPVLKHEIQYLVISLGLDI